MHISAFEERNKHWVKFLTSQKVGRGLFPLLTFITSDLFRFKTNEIFFSCFLSVVVQRTGGSASSDRQGRPVPPLCDVVPRLHSVLQGHCCHSDLAGSFCHGTKTKTHGDINGRRGNRCSWDPIGNPPIRSLQQP